MFIKRVKGLRLPPPQRKSSNFSNKDPKQPQPLTQKLKVFKMCVDPHARYIAMYSDVDDKIYMFGILHLMDCMLKYRQKYSENGKYSLDPTHMPLPTLTIPNKRQNHNIFDLKFTHQVQGTQMLAVSYFPNIIDLYSVVTGKKVQSIELEEYNSIMYVRIIGLSIYISTYSGKLLVYEGRQLTQCKKYHGQWIRFTFEHKYRTGSNLPLYINTQGKIMIGRFIISNNTNYQSKGMQSQALTQSYEQYMRLQSEKYSQNGTYTKYRLSMCENFLICEVDWTEFSRRFQIRCREFQWKYFCQYPFTTEPVINQFYSCQKITDNRYEIVVAAYGHHRSSESAQSYKRREIQRPNGELELETIEEKPTQQNECAETFQQKSSVSILKIHRNLQFKAKETITVICEVKDLKKPIQHMQWIAPRTLLLLDDKEDIYYVQVGAKLWDHNKQEPEPSQRQKQSQQKKRK